jgi:4-amino-4-deoxy-L-arabinose transferase-like glycosyltransferase
MTWPRAILCGLAVGIAFASKHSTILLVPMIVLLGAGELAGRWKANRDWPKREAIRLVLGVATIFAVALFVLWGVYGPEPGKGPEHSQREGAGQVILL